MVPKAAPSRSSWTRSIRESERLTRRAGRGATVGQKQRSGTARSEATSIWHSRPWPTAAAALVVGTECVLSDSAQSIFALAARHATSYDLPLREFVAAAA